MAAGRHFHRVRFFRQGATWVRRCGGCGRTLPRELYHKGQFQCRDCTKVMLRAESRRNAEHEIGGPGTRVEWLRYDRLLGTMPDLQIAKRAKCSLRCVQSRRSRLGIPHGIKPSGIKRARVQGLRGLRTQCPVCGQWFVGYQGRRARPFRYCSEECRHCYEVARHFSRDPMLRIIYAAIHRLRRAAEGVRRNDAVRTEG